MFSPIRSTCLGIVAGTRKGGLALWMARRRRVEDDDEPRGAAPVLASTAAAAAPVAATAAASTSDEVDPLAEAEVYIAYGRDARLRKYSRRRWPRILSARTRRSSCSRSTPRARTRAPSTSSRPICTGRQAESVTLGSLSPPWAMRWIRPIRCAGKQAPAAAPMAPAPASDLDFELGAGDRQKSLPTSCWTQA